MDTEVEDGEIKRTTPPSKRSLESLSMSDDEAVDPLEIKPPQARIHKSHRKSKHSSSKRHAADHRKKHHHSRSHREERHRHHRSERERGSGGGGGTTREERGGREERSGMGENRRMGVSGNERGGGIDERERSRKQHQGGGHQSQFENAVGRKMGGGANSNSGGSEGGGAGSSGGQLQSSSSSGGGGLTTGGGGGAPEDLRERLEKRREREREREERDARRQRLMEAERVKETYKRDIEERRLRREARERSRSRERKLAEAAAQAAATQAELERAGLVVVSDDESRSPLILGDSGDEEGGEVRPRGRDEEDDDDEEEEIDSRKQNGRDKTLKDIDGDKDSDSTKSDSDSSSSESGEDDSEEEESEDGDGVGNERAAKKGEEGESPPLPTQEDEEMELTKDTLPPYLPAIQGCRSVEEFQCLNRIEEGTYGVVYRARDKRTEEIVALKRLKMEKEKEGFPITSLREINTLLKAQHPNIVTVREIVVGSNMDKIFIVMDYVEHDLKSLMETMKTKKQVFIPGEVKCLMKQLLSAVGHLHDNWILHRDLKTSNLLLSHKGILKVGDFGLAREYGSPLKPYTPIVVTLWYRAPELLLGAKEYSTPIDMWSVGCIFAELLTMEPLFTGKSEVDQLNRIFKMLGTPNERIWTGYSKLPAVQKVSFTEFPVSSLRSRFAAMLSEGGLALLNGFLTYNPNERLRAEVASKHEYFSEVPLPIEPALFPTWPAKSEMGQRKKAAACSPKPPSGGRDYKQLEDTDEGFHMGTIERNRLALGPGFKLKF